MVICGGKKRKVNGELSGIKEVASYEREEEVYKSEILYLLNSPPGQLRSSGGINTYMKAKRGSETVI